MKAQLTYSSPLSELTGEEMQPKVKPHSEPRLQDPVVGLPLCDQYANKLGSCKVNDSCCVCVCVCHLPQHPPLPLTGGAGPGPTPRDQKPIPGLVPKSSFGKVLCFPGPPVSRDRRGGSKWSPRVVGAQSDSRNWEPAEEARPPPMQMSTTTLFRIPGRLLRGILVKVNRKSL